MPLTKITHIRDSGKLIPIGFPVYYDSEIKQYKVRHFCNECGDFAGCMCYDTLDDAAFNENTLLCGKKRCFVSSNFDMLYDSDDECLIPHVPLNECTKEELNDMYDDYITDIKEGWYCEQILSPEKMIDDLTDGEVDIIYDAMLDYDFSCDDMVGALCQM